MEHTKTDESLREKFSLLVHQHRDSLLKLCYLYLQDRSMAEDAVQETFVKAYKRFLHFRGECNVKTWLIRIAINTCKDFNRSSWNKRINHFVTPEMLPPSIVPFEKTDEELLLIIMNLPIKLREAVLLYYYHDLTLQQIASLLHITAPAVSNRLLRAKRIIRSSMEGRGKNE